MRTTAFAIALLFPALLTAADIPGIGPAGPVEKVHSGFEFTEGPAADGKGNLFFTDIPNQRIHKVDADGKLSVFREESNFANGLMFAPDGRLFVCEMAGQLTAISADGREREVLADKYDDNRFNAPNDLVIDGEGGVYFTDPAFRAPMPLPQGKTCVYYRSADGKVTRLIDDLPNPNGVILSPDEKTLYVIPSGQAEMMAYPIEKPGRIGEGRVFCTLKQPEGVRNGGGDGLAVDVKGNLYITSRLGVQVFSPDGELLGVLEFPEQPANVTFAGPDGKTLYCTARNSLYAVPLSVEGHRFGAGADD